MAFKSFKSLMVAAFSAFFILVSANVLAGGSSVEPFKKKYGD